MFKENISPLRFYFLINYPSYSPKEREGVGAGGRNEPSLV
jgi:hypothetical protein